MKTKRIKFLVACALAALSQIASAGSYWLGKAIDRSALVAGDYVYVSCAKSTSENVYVSARLLKSSDGTGRSARLTGYTDGTEVFELVSAPAQHAGTPSFYLRNIARDKYIVGSDTGCVYVATASDATSFEIVKPTLELGAFRNVTASALLLAHYESDGVRYLIPDVSGNRTVYSESAGNVYWTFRAAMTQCAQVGADELKNGMQVLFNNATNYLDVGPTQYLSSDTCTVKNPNQNPGHPLALSDGYDGRNEWRIISSGDKYIVRSVQTGGYLCATESDGIRLTPQSSDALTVEFEPTQGNYTIHDWWVTNEKSLVMYHMDGETKMKVGPYRGYGYTYYSTGINNIAWNVYQTGYHPLEKDVLGFDEMEDADAIPGVQRSKNNVVSMEFERPYVIKRIKYMASSTVKVQLGMFEGANQADFGDAIPFYMIKSEPVPGKDTTVEVNCSRGFRYVRYVGPKSAGSHRPRVTYYGEEGEGDDSQLYQITNLPLIVMHTQGEAAVTSKEVYRPGIASIISDGGQAVMTDSMEVRGRGNGTWTLDKKPYKLKFRKKHSVLGLPAKAKKWVLLANHQDKSLMRNLVSFEMSKQIGMRYTPAGTPVDVVLNGEYMGNFDIYDQMEVKKNRIEVAEMSPLDNTEPNISGGYLIEMDHSSGREPVVFYSSLYNAPISVHYPEEDNITPQQLEYIKNHYDKMESSVLSNNSKTSAEGIAKYIDKESFLKRFLLEEATANADLNSSIYIVKHRSDDHFYFYPAWDLDHTYDIFSPCTPSCNYNNYLSLVYGNSHGNVRSIISKVIKMYDDTLKTMWTNYRLRENLTYKYYEHYIDSMAQVLDESQRLNFIRWPVLDVELPFGTGIRYTYENEVKFLKETLKARLIWMDEHVGFDPSFYGDMGDVNNDGHVNLADVVAGGWFVQNRPIDEYNRIAADMSRDGKVTRVDMTLLAKELLTYDQPDVPADVTPSLSFVLSGDELRVGEEGVITVAYDNSATSVCAFQFDITLPEGMVLEAVNTTSNLLSVYSVLMNQKEGNTYSVILYSSYERDIPGQTDAIELKVKLADSMAWGDNNVKISHGVGAQSSSQAVIAQDQEMTLHVLPPVGIHAVRQSTLPHGKAYDLHGRPISPNHKGLYLQKGKKVAE